MALSYQVKNNNQDSYSKTAWEVISRRRPPQATQPWRSAFRSAQAALPAGQPRTSPPARHLARRSHVSGPGGSWTRPICVLRSPGRRCRERTEAASVVNAIGAIARPPVIENACLKAGARCGTFCLPEGSGVRRKGCRRWRDRPLLEAISCFRAVRDFNLPGCNQTAMTSVSRQARQTVRPPTGLFHWGGPAKGKPARGPESARLQSRRE